MTKIDIYDSTYEKLGKLAVVTDVSVYEVLDDFVESYFEDYRKDIGVKQEELDEVEEW